MLNKEDIVAIKNKYQIISKVLDERSRRIWAATEAQSIGYRGQSIVSKAIGISRTTIISAISEIRNKKLVENPKMRRPGGGRKKLIEKDKALLKNLETLVEPTTRGDPESPLRWTCKSTRQIAKVLTERGYTIGRQKVADLLSFLGYSLQSNRKTKEGASHPDRDKQFNHINTKVKNFQRRGEPIISVDTKKKELVGEYKNIGKEWQPKGKPKEVNIYDFVNKDSGTGKVSPYGVYDQKSNVGWVSVGIDHDTAEFAIESIRRWWYKMGKHYYPHAKNLLITADGGGSNGYRVKLWKVTLQKLADELKMKILVCHFPPGTSKWNKIEHRMFSFISMNWRGKPLISHEVIVNLIANTTNSKGLKIKAELDMNSYETGKKVSDKELKSLRIKKDDFHGEWNYTIIPNCF